jgi:hypothetical protein
LQMLKFGAIKTNEIGSLRHLHPYPQALLSLLR